jgi:hypothetical protein
MVVTIDCTADRSVSRDVMINAAKSTARGVSAKITNAQPTEQVTIAVMIGVDALNDTPTETVMVCEWVNVMSVGNNATTMASVNTKSRRHHRHGDKDGGDGIIGRIRVATDSRMSRSLLDAYPGGAVPVEEAASFGGLLELAIRYGYGEWSDEKGEEGKDYEEDADEDKGGEDDNVEDTNNPVSRSESDLQAERSGKCKCVDRRSRCDGRRVVVVSDDDDNSDDVDMGSGWYGDIDATYSNNKYSDGLDGGTSSGMVDRISRRMDISSYAWEVDQCGF